MKNLLAIASFGILIFACQKSTEISLESTSFVNKIQHQLNDSLNSSIRDSLDYNDMIVTKFKNERITILRIPFTATPIENKFVLVKLNEAGKILEGRIITIERDTLSYKTVDDNVATSEINDKARSQFDGYITIQYLNGSFNLESQITNGYIKKLHVPENKTSKKLQEEIDVTPPKSNTYKVLPEVVVTVSSGGGGGGASFASWYSLSSMITGSGGSGIGYITTSSGASAYYSSSNGTSSGSNGGRSEKTDTKDNYVRDDRNLLIDFEFDPIKVIDVESYLRCFDIVPDAGSSCSIELFTDIPVDEKPMTGFNPQTGSPGHTFIQIVKENDGQRITQNIGFYPGSQFKILMTTAPIDGVFADNEGHEFNASIKMSLTTANFKTIIDQIKRLARYPKYDIDDYNCTDFALQVFNSVRGSNTLEIPKLDIPETSNPYGSNTPQGVFLKLKEMKTNSSSESANITLPGIKGYVGASKGSCN